MIEQFRRCIGAKNLRDGKVELVYEGNVIKLRFMTQEEWAMKRAFEEAVYRRLYIIFFWIYSIGACFAFAVGYYFGAR